MRTTDLGYRLWFSKETLGLGDLKGSYTCRLPLPGILLDSTLLESEENVEHVAAHPQVSNYLGFVSSENIGLSCLFQQESCFMLHHMPEAGEWINITITG